MEEEGLLPRFHDFRLGNCVTVRSRAACSNIHVLDPTCSVFDTSSCYGLIGTVKSVLRTGDVKVDFGLNILCTIKPDELVKVPRLFPGALVKLVDDIRDGGDLNLEGASEYDTMAEFCGGVWVVLEDSDRHPDKVLLLLGNASNTLSRFHLDVIASPLQGRCMTDNISISTGRRESRTEAGFLALQNSMLDPPDAHLVLSGMPSTYAPGDDVNVSGEATDFLLWLKYHPGSTAMFPFVGRMWQIQVGVPAADWERSWDDRVPRLKQTALNQASSLLTTGKVLHVNHDGDAMVLFSDDCVWSIRSGLLQLAERTDACSQGNRNLTVPGVLQRFNVHCRRLLCGRNRH